MDTDKNRFLNHFPRLKRCGSEMLAKSFPPLKSVFIRVHPRLHSGLDFGLLQTKLFSRENQTFHLLF